jgi:uncharacterized protein YbjT (DUF2867 family)
MMDKPVFVTGATGYIGGRLVPRLLEMGYGVRAMGRSLEKLSGRPWSGHHRLELVEGDVLDAPSLLAAARGCGVVYYLVHSMIAKGGRYAKADRLGAGNMASVALEAGIERIIYLGGLGEQSEKRISRHLRSRHEVGEILKAGGVPVTVLRAAMILGSGSASFEILRYLVERLPVMITPRWVHMPTQPIAVGNVLGYLTGCLENRSTTGQTYDIGGPDVMSYADLFHLFSEEAGLPRRKVIPVPVLSPGLSARWIHLVTPVPAAIARPLAEGLSLPTVCTENRIRKIIPQELWDCRKSIRTALESLAATRVATSWSDAGALRPPEWAQCGDAGWSGGTTLDSGYRITIAATPGQIWETVRRIGGDNGWFAADHLWRLRGWLDRLAGGHGLRRGRRHPTELYTGDALDFWRVVDVKPNMRLMLAAEMRVPGEAILDFRISPKGEGGTELTMFSRFLPRGLGGMAYWYALNPLHQWVFSAMLEGIAGAVGKEVVGKPEPFKPAGPDHCRFTAMGRSG